MSKAPRIPRAPRGGKSSSPLLSKMLGQKPAAPSPATQGSSQAIGQAWRAPFDAAYAAFQRRDLTQALALIEPAAKHLPTHPDLHNLYAILLAEHRRMPEALAAWEAVLTLNPKNASALSNMGRTYETMGELEQALGYLNRALALTPSHADALLNKGVVLKKLGRVDEAMDTWRLITPKQPVYDQALFNMATVYELRMQRLQAIDCYERVLEMNPQHYNVRTNLLFVQHHLYPPQPHAIARSAHELASQLCAQHPAFTDWPVTPDAQRRLRIGLVSADLQDHPVGFFIEGLLRDPAARAFDWVAYANMRDETPLTQRIKPSFSAWRPIYHESDERVAAQVRADEIDVLIDLSGYTNGHRMPLFARKPAPVQVAWLGYFGTTGLPTMDAVIADPHCVPPVEEHWFTEKVYRMPHSRFHFLAPTNAPPVAPAPVLKKGFMTFGNFQNVSKINDAVLGAWGTIARTVPTARWRIQSHRLDSAEERAQLLARAEKAGMDIARMDLHGSAGRMAYLQAYAEVDLLLDTFPYPGGTTTMEALWMGVPTLTLALPGMLGRQGQGLMQVAGLAAKFVCHDSASYVRMAARYGQPAAWGELARWRSHARAELAGNPLFDAARFARDWVQLVQQIWRDACTQRPWPVTRT